MTSRLGLIARPMDPGTPANTHTRGSIEAEIARLQALLSECPPETSSKAKRKSNIAERWYMALGQAQNPYFVVIPKLQFARTKSFPHFKKNAFEIDSMITEFFEDKAEMGPSEKLSIRMWSFELLFAWMKLIQLPISLPTVSTNLIKLPQAIESSYPGARAGRMLPFYARVRMKGPRG